MFWVFILVEAAIVVALLSIGFVTVFDIKGDNSWKEWIHFLGGSLMFAAIWPFGRGNLLNSSWHFHPKTFAAGTVIFLATIGTWKSKDGDDDRSD